MKLQRKAVKVEMTETIACTPDDFLEFVMNIDDYARVDRKIAPILWSRRDCDVVEFACRPRLAGLRHPKVIQRMRLDPRGRVDIELAPRPANRIAHAAAHFEASFVCRPVPGGSDVTRSLEFHFAPLVGWAFAPLFRRRLPGEIRSELEQARKHFARASQRATGTLRQSAPSA
jgi:hypothetical protein